MTRSTWVAAALVGLLAGCGARPAAVVVQLVPATGPLGVSAQQVHWVAPAPPAPVPGDVRATGTATAEVGLEGSAPRSGDLVLLHGDGVPSEAGLVVPDRFGAAATGTLTVPGPAPCPGGLASRWEVTDVADARATLRLLDVVLLCDG